MARCYVPGETSIVDQLKKRSFELGAYSTLVLVSSLISIADEEYSEIRTYVESRFFNLLEMRDLEYNLSVVRAAQQP